jgi:hypothetical protein
MKLGIAMTNSIKVVVKLTDKTILSKIELYDYFVFIKGRRVLKESVYFCFNGTIYSAKSTLYWSKKENMVMSIWQYYDEEWRRTINKIGRKETTLRNIVKTSIHRIEELYFK